MLYRGINKEADEKNGGHLEPKGSSVAVIPLMDGKWQFDGTFNFGPCESNTARAHQIESGLYGGAGVSTTRCEKVAVRFATSNYTSDGYVYVIDESSLADAEVIAFEFDNPREPRDREVTLIAKSGGALPERIIAEKYAVSSDGKRVA